MSVTQEQESNTPSLVPPKKDRPSRATYARRRRANISKQLVALESIRVILRDLDASLQGGEA